MRGKVPSALERLGDGELGGKARMLPFVQRLVDDSGLAGAFAPHRVLVPETVVLATDCFAEFVAGNRLADSAGLGDDVAVRRRFLAGEHSERVRRFLAWLLDREARPLAVRSSSLSEDVHLQATAGLFATVLVPNRGGARQRQLEDAVKLVYASAFTQEADRYLSRHSIPREGERMAVAVEPVVGRAHGDLFFPLVSGVAQSHNYFPIGAMRPDDGVANVVVGLGRRAVAGRDGLRFCPRHPLVRPTLVDTAALLRTSQRSFDAVDLTADGPLCGEPGETLRTAPLEAAEARGAPLELVASVWDADGGLCYDNLLRSGPRLATFNRLLRGTDVPFAAMVAEALRTIGEGFGLPVELELVLDVERADGRFRGDLAVVQARPLPPSSPVAERVELPDVADEQLLLRAGRSLGNGALDGVRQLVFVDPRHFSLAASAALAAEVASLNEQLRAAGERYLLLGPGRWGSSNPAVGLPVRFGQIDQACLVAELATRELGVEPSQGTHFFHNVVAGALYYVTVDPARGDWLDLGWLRAAENTASSERVKLIRSERPLAVRVDGAARRALVLYD